MIIDYIKRNQYLFIFLSVILLVSFTTGFIIYFKLNNDLKVSLINNISNIKESMLNFNINSIFKHIFIIILLFFLSFSVLGYFLSIFYLFYINMSISFTFTVLCQIYGLKGLIFGILYFILFKLVYLVLFLLINSKLYGISKSFLGYFLYKNNIYIKNYVISIVILLILVIINDIFIYYLSNFFIKFMISML